MGRATTSVASARRDVSLSHHAPAGRRAGLHCAGRHRALRAGSYLDKTFGWQQKYEYRITTLSEVRAEGMNAGVEGDDSKPVEVFTLDIYPPGQPAGLQAVFSSVGQKPFIDLTWAPNVEGDLAGYNVFRWTEGESRRD